MTPKQKLELRRSEVRERLNDIAGLEGDAYTDEIKTEERALQDEYATLEQRHRSAIIAEPEPKPETRDAPVDAEQRERIELRGKAMVSNYLLAHAGGKLLTGAEAELSAACGVKGIPIELWDAPRPEQRQTETRAVTEAPGTVGINLDPIRPAIFANSIAPRLGIDMPRVPSGTYASATITTSQAAQARGPGDAIAGQAGAFTVTTATPKRISARLELRLEDIAAVGQANFEPILRENLSLVLSDELDRQAITGDGSGDNLTGILNRLANPAAPGATVVSFDDFIGAFAGGIDGLWANTVKDVGIVAGVDTYRLSAAMFRDPATGTAGGRGMVSFADYAKEHYGGWWTNSRMPAAAANIQPAILYRMGRSAMGASPGMRTAVCPHWGEVSIDDIYTGSASAERYLSMHVLLGDVIVVQPGAYSELAFRTGT